MKISDATNMYVGSSQASAAYLGTTKIWPVSAVTPGMRMLDGPTFRSYNNLTAGSSWSTSSTGEWRGDVYAPNLETADYDIWAPSGTYLELGQDDYFTLKQYAQIKFTHYTYTKIVFKDVLGNINPTASTGTVVYNAAASEIVWTGSATDFSFGNPSSTDFKFKYIYFEVADTLCAIDCLAFRNLNNLAVESYIQNTTYDLSTNSDFTLEVNSTYSGDKGKVIYSNAFRIYAVGSSGYIEISSLAGDMTSITINSLTSGTGNLDIPSNISADSGSISISANNRTLTWTGSASSVQFTWLNYSLTISDMTIEYTEI